MSDLQRMLDNLDEIKRNSCVSSHRDAIDERGIAPHAGGSMKNPNPPIQALLERTIGPNMDSEAWARKACEALGCEFVGEEDAGACLWLVTLSDDLQQRLDEEGFIEEFHAGYRITAEAP